MHSLYHVCVSGGMFEREFEGQELAFRHAIDKINSRGDLLPSIKLTYDIENPRTQDSFSASKKGNCKSHSNQSVFLAHEFVHVLVLGSVILYLLIWNHSL